MGVSDWSQKPSQYQHWLQNFASVLVGVILQERGKRHISSQLRNSTQSYNPNSGSIHIQHHTEDPFCDLISTVKLCSTFKLGHKRNSHRTAWSQQIVVTSIFQGSISAPLGRKVPLAYSDHKWTVHAVLVLSTACTVHLWSL